MYISEVPKLNVANKKYIAFYYFSSCLGNMGSFFSLSVILVAWALLLRRSLGVAAFM